MVTPSDPMLLVGVVLAVAGAASILFDAAHAGGSRRFVGYLIGLLLSLAAVGLLLATAV